MNAKLLAETEGDKYKYFEKEKKKIQNERAEKARLRHKNAVTKELLKHVIVLKYFSIKFL